MRKKIVSLILALALVSLPILLYAAAATVTSREQISMGNFAAVSGIVTITSGDTVTTGLRTVVYFVMSGNTSGGGVETEGDYGYTISGGVVTVAVENAGRRWRFFAIGTP